MLAGTRKAQVERNPGVMDETILHKNFESAYLFDTHTCEKVVSCNAIYVTKSEIPRVAHYLWHRQVLGIG